MVYVPARGEKVKNARTGERRAPDAQRALTDAQVIGYFRVHFGSGTFAKKFTQGLNVHSLFQSVAFVRSK